MKLINKIVSKSETSNSFMNGPTNQTMSEISDWFIQNTMEYNSNFECIFPAPIAPLTYTTSMMTNDKSNECFFNILKSNVAIRDKNNEWCVYDKIVISINRKIGRYEEQESSSFGPKVTFKDSIEVTIESVDDTPKHVVGLTGLFDVLKK